MRRVSFSAAVAAVCAVGLLTAGFVPANSDAVNATDAVAAVQAAAPDAVAGATGAGSSDGVAAEATIDDVRLSIPTDAGDGIALGEKVQIGLPFATQAGDAAASPVQGVIAYDNHNGSSTVPVIDEDGSLTIHTVIDNANAPKRYDYAIDLPAGASLTRSPEGVIAAVAADGAPLTVFGDAWAKDANGAAVPTHYELHGNTLTQVVETSVRTAFPVVADPQTTGVYSYNCVLTSGGSYFMKPGEKLTNCKGSYLQKYISGRLVQSLSLVYNGKYSAKVTGAGWCVVALAGAMTLVWNPPAATGVWLIGTASTLLGAYGSCVNL